MEGSDISDALSLIRVLKFQKADKPALELDTAADQGTWVWDSLAEVLEHHRCQR